MARSFTYFLGAAALAGCAASAGGINDPAEARTKTIKTATSISAQDRQEGAKNHPELLAEFGGAYAGPQAPYVARIGQNIAVQSGLSNARGDFTVTLLNSPVNNAFAIPGGYIYVTRQLMALMNDEAELAGVLGHEVGHVAARHSKKRQSAATLNAIGGILAQILGSAIGDNGGLLGALGGLLQNNAMQVAQYATLGFSRGQELEADQLGVQYLAKAGYDPMALSTVLASLANQTSLDARVAGQDARSIPEWASTHPDPASRVRNAATLAAATRVSGGVRNADAFMAAVDGVLYGDDPAQGVVEGQEFLHPDLRLKFRVPSGFGMQNGTTAVSISGSGGQAQFTTASYNGDRDAYIAAAFKAVAGDTPLSRSSIQRTTVGGIPAFYATARANSQSGAVDVTIFAYEFGPRQAYHFVTLTKAGQGGVFNSMFNSLRRLSASEAAAIKPRRIDVVTVGRGDSVASLSRRMAYGNYQSDRFRVLNGLTANGTVHRGQKVKLVVYAKR